MVKRYVRFWAEGTGENVGVVTVEGLCDALRDGGGDGQVGAAAAVPAGAAEGGACL